MCCYRQRAGTVVAMAANMACALSVLVQPYMPHICDVIQAQLKAPAYCNVISAGLVQYLPAGHRIGKVGARSRLNVDNTALCFDLVDFSCAE